MSLDDTLVQRALREAIEQYPHMSRFGPKLIWAELAEGGALLVRFETRPPPDVSDVWEFQNTVVKGYRRLVGQGPPDDACS